VSSNRVRRTRHGTQQDQERCQGTGEVWFEQSKDNHGYVVTIVVSMTKGVRLTTSFRTQNPAVMSLPTSSGCVLAVTDLSLLVNDSGA